MEGIGKCPKKIPRGSNANPLEVIVSSLLLMMVEPFLRSIEYASNIDHSVTIGQDFRISRSTEMNDECRSIASLTERFPHWHIEVMFSEENTRRFHRNGMFHCVCQFSRSCAMLTVVVENVADVLAVIES